MSRRKRIWLEIAPGFALRGATIGRSWIPGMLNVIVRDFDGKPMKTRAFKANCLDRDSGRKAEEKAK